MRLFAFLILLAAPCGACAHAGVAVPLARVQEPAPAYGFDGFEIYKLGDGGAGLAGGDWNGDGRNDLAVILNARSRIELFLRLSATEPDFDDRETDPSQPNPVRFDGRYRRVRLPVERRVQRIALGDFDGDGRTELVFAADAGELGVVAYDAAADASKSPKITTRRLDELSEGCALLAPADLDNDGRMDLLLATPDTLWSLSSRGGAQLGAPEFVDAIDKGLDLVGLSDLDGDGLRDLLYVYLDQEQPVRYRLRQASGGFGPRFELDLPQLRSARLFDVDGDGRLEVLAVSKQSGRLSTFAFGPSDDGERSLGREPLRRPLKVEQARRSFAIGDLDGDGADDIVLAEPEAAQVTLHFGSRQGRAMEARSFPTLAGGVDPHIGRIDAAGKLQLVLISPSERMLGSVALDPARRLAFPRTLPIEGEPMALELADFNGDGFDDALVIAAQGEGRNRKHALHIWAGSSAGFTPSAVGGVGEVGPKVQALDELKKGPTALEAADLDRDGDLDLIAFVPGEKAVPLFFLQGAQGFAADGRGADAPGLGILADAGPQNISVCGPRSATPGALLVASSNFARALFFKLDARGLPVPEVLEQYNAPSSDAKIAGVLALDEEGSHRIVLRDERARDLLILERAADGSTRVAERIEAGRIEFARLARGDFDGDGRADIAVLGANQFGIVYARDRGLALRESASHDPERSDRHFDQIVVGDLDGDGAPDAAVSEAQYHSLLVLRAPATELARVLSATVFEDKSFSAETKAREPREILCADLDGDGRDDIAMLAHDKLLIYRQ